MLLITPRQLDDEPERWLSVPHELHEPLLKLQEKMFPGFTQKLRDKKIHCFLCEGRKPFEVFIPKAGKVQLCTGYVGDPGDPDNLLLQCVDRS